MVEILRERGSIKEQLKILESSEHRSLQHMQAKYLNQVRIEHSDQILGVGLDLSEI